MKPLSILLTYGRTRAGSWLAVVAVAVAAIMVGEHRSRIAAVLDGMLHPDAAEDQGRLLKDGQAIVRGTRFFTTNFVSARLTSVGASGDLGVLALGNNLRLVAETPGAGLYFVYTLDTQQAYALELDGQVLRGTPSIRFRCHDWGLAAARRSTAVKNLLNAPSALAPPAWHGNARLDMPPRSADGSDASFTRVTFTPTATHVYQAADPVWPRRSFMLHFRARLVSGGPDIVAQISRGGGEDGQSRTVSLGPDWRGYTVYHDGTWKGRTPVQAVFTRRSAEVVFDVRDVRLFDHQIPDARARNVWGRAWAMAGTRLDVPGGALPSGKTRYRVSGTAAVGVQIESPAPFVYRLNSIQLNAGGDQPHLSEACGEPMGTPG